MSDFAVLLGGEITPTQRLKRQLTGRRIVAADSGIGHAKTLGLEVERWVGDFDSSTNDLLKQFADVQKEEWPSEKDCTDSDIAIDYVLQNGAKSLLMVGAFGGRTDHSANHLLLALNLPCNVILSSGPEEAHPVLGNVMPGWAGGTTFSILAVDPLEGLTIAGAKWPLENIDTEPGSSLTISNEVSGELAVSVKKGRALLIGHSASGFGE